MAKYSLELRKIIKDSNFKLFDFDYTFYTNNVEMKKEFENKFIQHYFFDEIGFETVSRFKHRLKEMLNRRMPYYSEMYTTILKSRNIEFLLNKDLTESVVRELSSTNDTTDSTSTNNTNTSSIESSYKESSINNGLANVDLNDSLTGTNKSNSTNKDSSTNISSGNLNSNSNQNESITTTSKGNIGVTSSAQLLKEWRQVIINIDEMIIEELNELFMGVY